MRRVLATLAILAGLVAIASSAPARAADYPHPGTNVMPTSHGFQALWDRLEQAIKDNKMGLVSRASASVGASRRGVGIPGNAVFGVYRNDFAVRMLAASVPAGIEAPLRFYITENADGTATLIYRTPSVVFAPYGGADLDEMARELDVIFKNIADTAAAK